MCIQSCLALCDPMDCSLPGFMYPGDFPGKNLLEEVAISFSRVSSPTQRLNSTSLVSPELAGGFFTTKPPGGALRSRRDPGIAFSEAPWEIQEQEDFKSKCEK